MEFVSFLFYLLNIIVAPLGEIFIKLPFHAIIVESSKPILILILSHDLIKHWRKVEINRSATVSTVICCSGSAEPVFSICSGFDTLHLKFVVVFPTYMLAVPPWSQLLFRSITVLKK